MPPRRGMFPASLSVGHLVDGLSHCLFWQRVFDTPTLLLSLAVQHQSGLKILLSLSPWCHWSKVFHEARPLSPTSAWWYTDSDQQPCLKLNCTLQGDCTVTSPNQPKVINTSNLSLDRDPTDGNTNFREIQDGYAHFLATLYVHTCGIH
jgi:hypothetical protein